MTEPVLALILLGVMILPVVIIVALIIGILWRIFRRLR